LPIGNKGKSKHISLALIIIVGAATYQVVEQTPFKQAQNYMQNIFNLNPDGLDVSYRIILS
jgi:hypothetical protein